MKALFVTLESATNKVLLQSVDGSPVILMDGQRDMCTGHLCVILNTTDYINLCSLLFKFHSLYHLSVIVCRQCFRLRCSLQVKF